MKSEINITLDGMLLRTVREYHPHASLTGSGGWLISFVSLVSSLLLSSHVVLPNLSFYELYWSEVHSISV